MASPRAADLGRMAGGTRLRPGGPVGRSGRQRCVGEARGCSLRLPGPPGLGSYNVGGRARRRPRGETVRMGHTLTAPSPGPQWVIRGTDTMLAPGTAPAGAIGDPTTPQKVLRGVLQAGDQA